MSSVTTSQAILEAARDLFFDQGLAGTSMRDIAHRVGIVPSSLYNHFATKDALVIAVMERSFEVVDDVVRPIFNAPPSLRLLRVALREHALQHIHGIKETAVFRYEGRHMPDDVRTRVVELRGVYEQRFYQLATTLAERGCITSSETLTRMRMLLSAGGDISDWFRPGRRLNEEQVADLYANFGLAALEASPSE